MNIESNEYQNDKPLGVALSALTESFANFANNRGVENYIKNIDSDFVFVINDIRNEILNYINSIDGSRRLQNTSLILNMRLISKMLDELSISVSAEIERQNHREVPTDPAILKLIVGILSCLKNIEVDMFFFSGKFIGKDPSEYKNFAVLMDDASKAAKNIKVNSAESSRIITEMKGDKAVMSQVTLANSFKSTVDDLSAKIKNFDIVNYFSLGCIFILTVFLLWPLLFPGEAKQILRLEGVSVYNRFFLILPFIFLSWFASKRSQFLYQIKEEYSYKYTTALAYEGYKNEVDKLKDDNKEDAHALKKRLIDVTIDNIARSPLTQFDKNSDHAPYAQFIKEFRNK